MNALDMLVIFSALLNIGAAFICAQLYKQNKAHKDSDISRLQQSMADFVGNMEKENEVLYHNILEHINVKEREFHKQLESIQHIASSVKQAAGNGSALENGEHREKKHADPELPEREDETVLALHKQGFSPKQIAKILKIDHGEIELVINMLEKRKAGKN